MIKGWQLMMMSIEVFNCTGALENYLEMFLRDFGSPEMVSVFQVCVLLIEVQWDFQR